MMPTGEECVCCSSIAEVVAKAEEIGAPCIAESEGFEAVCLNQWVLLPIQTTVWQIQDSIHFNFMCSRYSGSIDSRATVD